MSSYSHIHEPSTVIVSSGRPWSIDPSILDPSSIHPRILPSIDERIEGDDTHKRARKRKREVLGVNQCDSTPFLFQEENFKYSSLTFPDSDSSSNDAVCSRTATRRSLSRTQASITPLRQKYRNLSTSTQAMIFLILVVATALFGRCEALPAVPSATLPKELASLSTTRLWKKFRIKINSPHMPYAHKPSEVAKLGEKIALAEKILDELASRAAIHAASATNNSQQERWKNFTQRLSDFNVRIHMLEQNSQATSVQRGHYKLASWLDLSARQRTPLKGAVDLPLVTYLATEYIETRVLQFRSLLLKCLDLGADPTAASPWTIGNAPISWYLTLRIPLDVELALRIIQAGASLQAWYRLDQEADNASNQRKQDKATVTSQPKIPSISGISFLQALCQDFEQRTVVRRILSVVDEYFFMMRTHPDLFDAADGAASLKVAFSWLSEVRLQLIACVGTWSTEHMLLTLCLAVSYALATWQNRRLYCKGNYAEIRAAGRASVEKIWLGKATLFMLCMTTSFGILKRSKDLRRIG